MKLKKVRLRFKKALKMKITFQQYKNFISCAAVLPNKTRIIDYFNTELFNYVFIHIAIHSILQENKIPQYQFFPISCILFTGDENK